jgi:hypothetical protein
MFHSADYFDNVDGDVPQLVLAALTLQAGNRHNNNNKSNLVDVADKVDWSLSYQDTELQPILSIQIELPIDDLKYLLDNNPIWNKIGAWNDTSTQDNIYLARKSVYTAGGMPVEYPASTPKLTASPYIVENRVAFLLLLLQKRKALYTLYNALRAVWDYSFSTLTLPDGQGGFTSTLGSSQWMINVGVTYLRTRYKINFADNYTDLLDWTIAEINSTNPIAIEQIDIPDLIGILNEYRDVFFSAETGDTTGAENDIPYLIVGEVAQGGSDASAPNWDGAFDRSAGLDTSIFDTGNTPNTYAAPSEPKNSLPEC